MRTPRTMSIALVAMLALTPLGEAFARNKGFSSSPPPRAAPAPVQRAAPAPVPKSAPMPSVAPATPKVQPIQQVTPPPEKKGFGTPSIPQPLPAAARSYDSDAARARMEQESQRSYEESKRKAALPPSTPPPQQRPGAFARDATPPQMPPSAAAPTPTSTSTGGPIGQSTPPPRTPQPESRTVVVERHYDSGSSINPWFVAWMIQNQQNQNMRAENDRWIYHNRDRLSPEQTEELRRKDANLDTRLRELEVQQGPRDPGYQHKYQDERKDRPAVESRTGGSNFWVWLGIILLASGVVYYVICVHRFGGRATRRYA